ncbi:MAG: alpha/beta-hydrolase family protein, partial [Acidimicrobiia bacterium]
PSDPVGYWSWDTLWKPQEWTQEPIGYDVPQSVRWVPFTTFVQVVADLIAGFSAEVGHGHNYNNHFVEAWSTVAPPDHWTIEEADRLEKHLESIAPLPGQ